MLLCQSIYNSQKLDTNNSIVTTFFILFLIFRSFMCLLLEPYSHLIHTAKVFLRRKDFE